MTPADAARVLTACSVFDNRKVTDEAALAWHLVIGDLDLDDALQAVQQHYARSRDWLMPVDIRDAVKRLRADRLARQAELPPAADPDDVPGYLADLRAGRTAIATGTERPRDMRAIDGMVRHVDDAVIADARDVVTQELAKARTETARLRALPPADPERLAQARAELAARQPVPLPDAELEGSAT